MDPDRWQRVTAVFDAALLREPVARPAFLAEACADDPSLVAEVQALLAADERAARGTWSAAAKDEGPATLSPGARLGPYVISGPIGAGGMGEVYRARDATLRRDVAIKILPKAFLADPERRARFNREARLLAALNHPHIAAIYGVEDTPEGIRALILELVEGATLADRLTQGPIPINEALRLASHIADALDAAHEKGIVHRDLKPANIKITAAGVVKVLDFGMAKAVRGDSDTGGTSGLTMAETRDGTILGTPAYMSPEQARGRAVDKRTDIWAFGCVLYEMLVGRAAFARETITDTLAAIVVSDADWSALPPDTPASLLRLMRRCLEKEPAQRYGSAEDVHLELKTLEASLMPSRRAKLTRNAWIAVAAAVVVAGVTVGWLWHRSSRERWVLETATPEIARLVDAGEFAKAAALTREARAVLPKDSTLEKLWILATVEASLDSDPTGADVSIRPYRSDPSAWETPGGTPLKNIRLPKNDYVWRLVKPGFAPASILTPPHGLDLSGQNPFATALSGKLKLRPEGQVPPEMVMVQGGVAGLGGTGGNEVEMAVDDFLIDRHEVTNEEYKKFVDAGGYQKREFWKQPFVREGREIPWEAAVSLFRDATGRPGPATWQVGTYPKGLERHPVAGVSWYEAAAYAEFVGKSLPTAYHWTQASQSGTLPAAIANGSNFRGVGTQPVGRPGTLSGFGTTDMAGNVKEWCLNEGSDGKRFILGGGFGDPPYMFNLYDEQLPWRRDANFGFRCVKLDAPPSPAASTRIEIKSRNFRNEKPVSDDVFNAYARLYAYDRGELHSRTEETETAEGWTREKVSFDAAYGNERVTAHLLLPRNLSPPFQTIVFFPGIIGLFQDRMDLAITEEQWDFLTKSGRALMLPIYKGMYERRDGLKLFQPPVFYRDHVIMWSKDLGRSLDYLEQRKDIDATKLAYLGYSMGAAHAPVLLAVESRFNAAILSSGGLVPRRAPPEVDGFNFVTHVKIPILMLNGRYDAFCPVESSQLPLFRLLGTPDRDKKHVIYEAIHAYLPHTEEVRESLDWLDKYLGPVRR